jgi:hypothetical protein
MKTLAIILIVLLAVPSPALAIRKIEKKSKGQSSNVDNAAADQKQTAGENAPAADRSPERESKKDVPRQRRESRQPEKEDRFIDENSDGINDRISKQPAVKIKRREPPRNETPKREKPKPESSVKPEKVKRRDR